MIKKILLFMFQSDFSKNKFFIPLAILLFFGLTDSNAQLLGTVGASVGSGFINTEYGEVDGEDFKIEENNLAWKVFAATNWKFLGLEGGYRDFGTVESDTDYGKGSSKSRGGDIYATGTIKFLKILSAFAKAGAYFGRTTYEFTDAANTQVLDETERQTSFAWGLGAGLNLGMLHLRLEYENMHIDPGNLGMLSLGVGINLSKKE